MISFACPSCGRVISIDEKYSGKKGKCPKCKGIVVVPETSTIIEFKCESCGHEIKVPDKYRGKKGKCPKCKNLIRIPDVYGKVDEITSTESSNPSEVTSRGEISGEKIQKQEIHQNLFPERDISLRFPILGVIVLGSSIILIGLATGYQSVIEQGIIPFVVAPLLLIPTALMQILVHWFFGFKPKFATTYACYLLGYLVINITMFILLFILVLAFPDTNISMFSLGLFVEISWFILTASVCGSYLNDPEKGPIGFWKACLPLFIVLLILFFVHWAAFFFVVRGW